MAEPILGVGGFITPPKEYFEIAVPIARNHGGLFIADEVQTAWGRTGGKWWGVQQYGSSRTSSPARREWPTASPSA